LSHLLAERPHGQRLKEADPDHCHYQGYEHGNSFGSVSGDELQVKSSQHKQADGTADQAHNIKAG
jgi:hypothetical protein